VRYGDKELPLLGEPSPWRRLSEQDHTASEQGLLDTRIIRRRCWASVVFSLPKPDGALVDSEHDRKLLLRHPRKGPRRAQLPTT
jgi:hypothetical protein